MRRRLGMLLAMLVAMLLMWSPAEAEAEESYPIWEENVTSHVTLRAGEEVYYLFTPSASGEYTFRQQSSVISMDIRAQQMEDKDADAVYVKDWVGDGESGRVYRLKAGAPYILTFSMWSGHTEWPDGFTDEIWIRAGEPPKLEDRYEPFPASGFATLTLTPGQQLRYKFTCPQDGRYVLHSQNTVVDARFLLENMADEERLEVATPLGKMFGGIYTLTAGKTYILDFSLWEGHPYPQGFTDTYYLEAMKPLESASILSADAPDCTNIEGYPGGQVMLFVAAQPLYVGNRVTSWTVSDPSVARLVDGMSGHLELVGPGSATVTATVEGRDFSTVITVKESPVLKPGETVDLTFDATTGVTCLFTPAQSGTYWFHMTGAGGTTHIEETEYGLYWENSGSFSAWLQGGRTYRLQGAFALGAYTVKVTGETGGGTTVPTPTVPSGTTVPTQPNLPTDGPKPTEGNQPTQPTQPTQTTQTTQPTLPTVTAPPTTGMTPPPQELLEITGDKAVVSGQQLKQLLTEQIGDRLALDAAQSGVSKVVLSAEVLAQLTDANVQLQVSLPAAKVTLDATVLATIAGKTDGAVELSCQKLQKEHLSPEQLMALEEKQVGSILQLELTFEGGSVHDFMGGTATVRIPEMQDADAEVWYLAPDGTAEQMPTELENGELVFRTGHFSEYAVLKSQNRESSSIWLWILLGVAAVGAATALTVILLKKKSGKKA